VKFDPNSKVRWQVFRDGILRPEADTAGMMFPVECTRCGHVHDAAKVKTVARYADCTVWACPGCGSHIDDRPIGWGGSARRLNR
jgi:hypothetical protein